MTNHKNLEILADHLEQNVDPNRFVMLTFVSGGYLPIHAPDTLENECGTTACVLGWATTHPDLAPEPDEDWSSYTERVFGLGINIYGTLNTWDFIFSEAWPNDIPTAVKRLRAAADPDFVMPDVRNYAELKDLQP